MNFLEKLERKLPFLAVKNLTVILIGGQVVFFLLYKIEMIRIGRIILVGTLVESGEYWRLFSFLFVPASDGFFIIFFWYLYYLYGTALENTWGSFKYNIYLVSGYLLSISEAFIFPMQPITNSYFYLSIFFAFAYLHPDFELLLFFILPVKIKWLALLTAAFYLYQAVTGDWHTRTIILLSVGNFFLFFSRDIFLQVRYGNRKMVFQVKKNSARAAVRHTCSKCGKKDTDDQYTEFRYRNEDGVSTCYCMACLKELKAST